jgi:AraC-like DNA-binding protein
MIKRSTNAAPGSDGLIRMYADGPPSGPGTIAICFVDAALQGRHGRNLNTNDLMTSVGLAPSLLQLPQARVSAKAYGELWRAIAAATDDEFFGQDSRRMKVGSFAMLCHTVIGCKTLGRALTQSARFLGIMLEDISANVIRIGEEAKLVFNERNGAGSRPVFAHELLLTLLYGLSCWLVRRRIPLLRGEFSYAEPAHSSEYQVMYCTDLKFECPNTFIAFQGSHLDLPVMQNERSVKDFLRAAPENILVKYKNSSSLASKIRRRLRFFPPGSTPDFKRLACELNLTSAILRHQLQAEGTSYQLIRDQFRRDIAIEYLSHSDKNVSEIAAELGFAERSAFHRAFRKWTGASPGEFRRKVVQMSTSNPRSQARR